MMVTKIAPLVTEVRYLFQYESYLSQSQVDQFPLSFPDLICTPALKFSIRLLLLCYSNDSHSFLNHFHLRSLSCMPIYHDRTFSCKRDLNMANRKDVLPTHSNQHFWFFGVSNLLFVVFEFIFYTPSWRCRIWLERSPRMQKVGCSNHESNRHLNM